MQAPRYLTKSRFKLASECPRKLYYTNKKSVYADQNSNDPFLAALADGGFQVGELAKHYFPGGIEIGRGDLDAAVERTRELLLAGDVIIYEAAIIAENYFIYADILLRRDDTLYLYEVKAKSYDPVKDSFIRKDGKAIRAEWEPYILDVAFQKLVLRKAFPEFAVVAHLALVDKTSRCATDGLNQKFRVRRLADGGTEMIVDPPTAEDLSSKLLCEINIDEICERIYQGQIYNSPLEMAFEETARAFSDQYFRDVPFPPSPSKVCRTCEFRATEQDKQSGLKDGFRECWSERFNWSDEHFSSQSVLDIWNFRGTDKLIGQGRVTIDYITRDDLGADKSNGPGLSTKMRQWLQIEKAQRGDNEPFIDKAGIAATFNSFTYPLHFIDFETSMPAIPFNRGRRPYEGIAFQYSHHVVLKDGTVEHRGQFLQARPGVFPSYEFVRALRRELENSPGTIFQYSSFENTYLNHIYEQLSDDGSVPDREELMYFIRSFSRSKSSAAETWAGERAMVDLLEILKRYYFDPLTRGSNSIKAVLPAMLQRSSYLKEKYSQPVYGADGGIASLNFKDWAWVRTDDSGGVMDPYRLLPRLFEGLSDEELDALILDTNELRDGGAALTAYSKLQFQEMSEIERNEIENALLKYCELDTLAMVMIYEGWREMVS